MRVNTQIALVNRSEYDINPSLFSSHRGLRRVEKRVPTFHKIQQYRLIQLLQKESRKHQRMMMKSDRMLRCDAMRCNDQML